MKAINMLFVLVLMIGLVSAGSLGTYKQNEEVDLRIPLYDTNLSHLNSATTTQLSIFYPSGDLLVKNASMTWNENYFNYTILPNESGEYTFNLQFSNGDARGSVEGFFDVTPTGFNLSLTFYFIIMIMSLGIVIFGFMIRDNWVIVLGGFGMVFLGLFLLFYGIDGFKDSTYTWGIGIIILMLGSYFSIRGSMEALSDE